MSGVWPRVVECGKLNHSHPAALRGPPIAEGGGPLINIDLGLNLTEPAKVLIEKVSSAIGTIHRPREIREIARAEAEAALILAQSEIKVTDLKRRAMIRFIDEETQRQANMESILEKAIPNVEADAKPENVEDDWFTHFFDNCRLISDEEMQQIWAALLSGEANSPGTISRRTIAALSSFEHRDAQLVQALCSYVFEFDELQPLIYDYNDDIYAQNGINFIALQHLDSIGVISFSESDGYNKTVLKKQGVAHYQDIPVLIDFPFENYDAFNVGCVLLTETGRQLASVCHPRPALMFRQYIIEKWKEQGITAK